MSLLESARKTAMRRRLPPGSAPPTSGKYSIEPVEVCDRSCTDMDHTCLVEVDEPAVRAGTDGIPELAEIDTPQLVTALTIRRTEERLLRLFSEGRLFGTVHTCIGQEWSAVAVGSVLREGDYLFSNHRGHGHYLARTDDVEGLIAEIMGRRTGTCGGRGGSQHLYRDGFFSNGIQGGIMPVAAGLAMGCLLRGADRMAAVCIGDGTFGEGVVYETMNIAARWQLPLLILVEDNGIAQSTPRATTLAGSMEGRARAFDIEWFSADTWHPAQLIRTAQHAAGYVRGQRRPAMLRVRTFRLKAHSKGDDDRPAELVEAYARQDLLNRLLHEPAPVVTAILDRLDARLDAAVMRAEEAPMTDPASIQQNELGSAAEVHGGQDDETGGQRSGGSGGDPHREQDEPQSWSHEAFQEVRISEGIGRALQDAMRDNPRVLVLGEDVRDPYGGAFKVTAGLSSRFPDRVFNTPISEAAIVGIGSGLAMDGWLPVVEIMFGDFLLLAADQWVNHAAKFAWMYNDKVRVPMILRTPMGGYRGYGPTHSQSLEKHLLGVPGTTVMALHHRHCPRRFYRKLLTRINGPTLVVENKLLYTRRASSVPPPGWSLESLRHATTATMTRLRSPREPQLTMLAYGGMAPLAEAAAVRLWEEEELACELLFPDRLYPPAIEPILESARRTGHLLVIEEAQGFAAWGGEVLARLQESGAHHSFTERSTARGRHERAVRVSRIHARSCPIPASRPAELHVLPGQPEIMAAALSLVTG